jgi:hypothetical protein
VRTGLLSHASGAFSRSKNGDYDWLMGIFTKAVSNQIAPSTNNGDSHWRNIVSFVVADTLN